MPRNALLSINNSVEPTTTRGVYRAGILQPASAGKVSSLPLRRCRKRLSPFLARVKYKAQALLSGRYLVAPSRRGGLSGAFGEAEPAHAASTRWRS